MNEITEAQLLAYAKQKFNELPFTGAEIQWAVALYNYLDSKTRPQAIMDAEAEPELPLEDQAKKVLTQAKN